ncbi:MAG: nicotinate-nucleotide--dimethylbenzimidazole phosphoribosyltransferase [Candidatus Sericytochromatia bacterium]|nr:nicotinate-nucleotide--dimethylbenzimidazole phosphoribosyltransferase [Candidatus Sericytochromatia bacterium]
MDQELRGRLQGRLDEKTKPVGALGRLEELAMQLGLILGTDAPRLHDPQLVVFAADHGLAAHGVSAYPSDVTWQMVENFLAGGAAVSVLARQHGVALTVVDCGVAHEVAPRPGLVSGKVARGTADARTGPAMTPEQRDQAMDLGREVVRGLAGNVLLLGEMGIGNTSAAAMLLARLTGRDLATCTGAGTGLDEAGIARKVTILREVLARHAEAVAPLDALAAFGGFEIAAMVGAVQEAVRQRRVVVVDGFITTAAVLVAHALDPRVTECCVFAHTSGERGHGLMLADLGARPLLDLGLRLGEGSGAALAYPLLESATRMLAEMATFASAGVAERNRT